MIDKKLDELGRYAKEIEKEDPLRLIGAYFKQNELQSLENTKSEFGKDFVKDVIQVINNFKEEGLPDKMISYHLFNVFVSFIKKSLVELKAIDLDIDTNLYKNEMRFLFKGRRK